MLDALQRQALKRIDEIMATELGKTRAERRSILATFKAAMERQNPEAEYSPEIINAIGAPPALVNPEIAAALDRFEIGT